MKQILTREKVRANRIKWAEFLLEPGRQKAQFTLDAGDECRCCLGHGAFALGVESSSETNEDGRVTIFYGEPEFRDSELAPEEFVELVGLWSADGGLGDQMLAFGRWDEKRDLAAVNDETGATPQDIGSYLMTVIEGGMNTPFRPLTEYPEAM